MKGRKGVICILFMTLTMDGDGDAFVPIRRSSYRYEVVMMSHHSLKEGWEAAGGR